MDELERARQIIDETDWGSYDSQHQRMPYWGMRGGDHMWLQDGLLHKHDIRDFYLKMLRMIDQQRACRKS